MSELTELTAVQLLDGYRKGDFSPVDATRAVLDRIEVVQPAGQRVRTASTRTRPSPRREAVDRTLAAGEPRGLLDGVPVSVKDILLHARRPDPARLQTVDPQGGWDEDAPSVARLREHGAVFVGKTTTPEFGWKGVTDSPLSGVTRNPYDLSRTVGRLQRRQRGGRGAGRGSAVPRHGRRRLGPYPGRLLRDLRR